MELNCTQQRSYVGLDKIAEICKFETEIVKD